MQWKHMPQENEGTYYFTGRFFVTSGIQQSVPFDIILSILITVKQKAIQEGGLDYLQVFQNSRTNQKLFFIDQLNQSMKDSGEFQKDQDYCTLMLSREY